MITITEDDADRRITAAVGDEIAVTLAENPTTGFRWAVESLTAELTLVSSEFEPPADARPGAGGRRAIRLRAGGHGTGELRLRYSRDGDDADDARRCKFKFVIKSA